MVIDAHKKYIDAGADMITTNNYTVVPGYYRKAFDDWEERIPKDAATAARLAVEARRQCNRARPVRVMGCLPPLCESHRPDLSAKFIEKEGKEFCVKTYKGIAKGLLEGGPVDGFLAETMNSWEEAECAIEAVKDLGKPLIVSFEGALRDHALTPQPETATEVADKVMAAKAAGAPIEALCFNCAPPEDIEANLKVLDDKGYRVRLHAAGIVLGAYANVQDRKKVLDSQGFDATQVSGAKITVREDLQSQGYIEHLHGYIRRGVAFIGGCCGSTPEQMRMLSDSLSMDGAEEAVEALSHLRRRRLAEKKFCSAGYSSGYSNVRSNGYAGA